jgi:hypothetical protein
MRFSYLDRNAEELEFQCPFALTSATVLGLRRPVFTIITTKIF